MVTANFAKLEIGEWRSDWKGATLASKRIDADIAEQFLNAVLKVFLKNG